MSAVRPSGLGATRTCPHCKSTVLASASICPGCQHHLRFSAGEPVRAPAVSDLAMQVEASIRRRQSEPACEYCVTLLVADAQGKQLARHIVNVGALAPAEGRTFKLAVELIPARVASTPKRD
jgi:hypothetical protein